jgi:hypothetical protein
MPPAPQQSAAVTRILSREALAASSETGLENSAWIDGAFTAFRKGGPGLSFSILLGEPQLSAVVQDQEALVELKSQAEVKGESGHKAGRASAPSVVGHYCAGDAIPEWTRDAGDQVGRGGDGVWWTTVEDARLGDFVGRASLFLEQRLSGLGRWTSFADWVRRETGADLASDEPGPLTPLDYWWLAGETESLAGVHALPVYPAGLGLYVPPEDGLIRVYSCMMKAALAEAAYSAANGAAVKSSPLPCLGCLLGGAAELLGRDVVKGALLDERWRIEFAVCEEHGMDLPAHLSVFDGDEAYDLVGCTEQGTVPLWVPRVWDATEPHDLHAWA